MRETFTFLEVVRLIVLKDLAIELRSREIVYTTLFFAISCVLVFAFGLVREGTAEQETAPAILWIAIAFSGTLAIGRTFERERQNETLRALLASPADRPALYLGKFVGVLGLLLAVECVLVPLVALMFGGPFLTRIASIVALLVLGSAGFAAVGTLFAAMLIRSRSRDVLLPIVLYPMTVPVIIAGVRGTAALLQAEPAFAVARAWGAMLLCFDVVFITLALWTFDAVMTDGA